MKKTGRTLSVIFLTAIYCYAIGVAPQWFVHHDVQHNQTAEQGEIFSTISTNLFSHISQSEKSFSNFNNIPVRSFKTNFNGLSAISKTTEQLFETEFSQYTNFSRNILTQHRKEDIIFPFHYFW